MFNLVKYVLYVCMYFFIFVHLLHAHPIHHRFPSKMTQIYGSQDILLLTINVTSCVLWTYFALKCYSNEKETCQPQCL